MKYVYDATSGKYLGAYNDAAPSPVGSVSGPAPSDARDKYINGVLTPYVTSESLNQALTDLFTQLLPTHLGKTYCTPSVIADIMMTKVALIDANNIDPTGYLGKATLQNLSLPMEMEADKNKLLAIFP